MNKNINALINAAIAQEDALRSTIEAINAADKEYLGRGPSGKLLGVLAYGHLSALRNCLGSANRVHTPDFGLADKPTVEGQTITVRRVLEDGDAVIVQNGKVFYTTTPRLADALARYLMEKTGVFGSIHGIKEWLNKYVGRFFRHLGHRAL